MPWKLTGLFDHSFAKGYFHPYTPCLVSAGCHTEQAKTDVCRTSTNFVTHLYNHRLMNSLGCGQIHQLASWKGFSHSKSAAGGELPWEQPRQVKLSMVVCGVSANFIFFKVSWSSRVIRFMSQLVYTLAWFSLLSENTMLTVFVITRVPP